jgi:hypothetical protein
MSTRQIITKDGDRLNFGQYNGRTVRHVAKVDPQYILWLDVKEIVEFPQSIIDECRTHPDDERPTWGDGWDGFEGD